jgi:hypothetical protein
VPTQSEERPGVAIDSRGGSVVDPTENVKNLVIAGEKSQEAIREADNRFLDAQLLASEKLQKYAREAEAKFQNYAREAEAKFQNSARKYESRYQSGMRESETRRIDQLASTRQEFQNTIRDMLAESVRTTSTLVSTQLVQIQATFDTRVSKLEAQAFTAAGRSSVADPAMEGAMIRMNTSIASLSTATADSINKIAASNADAMLKLTSTIQAMQTAESRVGGRDMGKQDTNARLLAVVMAVAAVASPVIAILVTIMAMRGGVPH